MMHYPNPKVIRWIWKWSFACRRNNTAYTFLCSMQLRMFLTTCRDDDDDDDDDHSRSTRIVDKHNVYGFACYRLTNIDQYQTDPVVYSGKDVMTTFYEHVMSESREISHILGIDVPMKSISSGEQSFVRCSTTLYELWGTFHRIQLQSASSLSHNWQLSISSL